MNRYQRHLSTRMPMIFDFAKITGRGDEREMGTGSRMLLTRKAHSSSKVPFFKYLIVVRQW